MAQVFSYVRFSSAKQQLGVSLQRQVDLAVAYAEKHKLGTVDTHSFQDLGVSAFRGKNAVEGKLGTFIKAIDSGVVKAGDYLLVESLDRISRDEVDEALEVFLSITRRGVVLVTLADEQIYSKERIKQDKGVSLIISIAQMVRAHDESAMKSKRVKDAWQRKRNDGRILTATAPAWLKLSEDRKKWIVITEKANVVKRIFKLASEGQSTMAIMKLLNEQGVPTLVHGRLWSFGLVANVLRNSSVIGTFTPKRNDDEPIPSYYPAIVDPNLFYAVRELVTKRRWIADLGKQKVSNLFVGMAYCGSCGGRMRTVGGWGPYAYVRCTAGQAKSGCRMTNVPYHAVENAMLEALIYFFEQDLSGEVAEAKVDPRTTLRAERDDLKVKIEKLLDMATAAPDSKALGTRLAAMEVQLAEIEDRLGKAHDPVPLPTQIEIEDLFEKHEKLKQTGGQKLVDQRRKMQSAIRRIVHRVDLWSGEIPKVAFTPYLSSGDPGRPIRVDVEPWMQPQS